MMMVPMMVPQDAVSQIAAGYPAAHQYQPATSTSYTPPTTTMTSHHPFFPNIPTPHPWMSGGGGGGTLSSSTPYHPHPPSSGMRLGQQPHLQQQQHPSLPPSSQLHQYIYHTDPAVGLSNVQTSGGLLSMTASDTASEPTYLVPIPHNLSSNNYSSRPPAHDGMLNSGIVGGDMSAHKGNDHVGQTQAPPDATTTAAIGLLQHPLSPTGGTVANDSTTHNISSQPPHHHHHASLSTGASAVMATNPTINHVTATTVPIGMHPQHFHYATTSTTPHDNVSQTSHAAASYYPSQGHDAAVSTMIMNHPYQHSHANPTSVAGAPNSNYVSYSSFAINDSSVSPEHHHQQQQLQQQPSTQQQRHHHDESNKPLVQDTTTHQGGGGNLAHCA
jgi:hypothetical protein